MNRIISSALAIALAAMASPASAGTAPPALPGDQLFEIHCSGCHSNGGNMVNPAKTLQKMVREANGVKTAQDIVRKVRNPGKGMTRFTHEDLSDRDAKAIAEYVLVTF
jgi:cytochrome c6